MPLWIIAIQDQRVPVTGTFTFRGLRYYTTYGTLTVKWVRCCDRDGCWTVGACMGLSPLCPALIRRNNPSTTPPHPTVSTTIPVPYHYLPYLTLSQAQHTVGSHTLTPPRLGFKFPPLTGKPHQLAVQYGPLSYDINEDICLRFHDTRIIY